MFWNARGIRDEVPEVLDTMKIKKVGIGLFMETRIYGEDLSQGDWKWLSGTEVLPSPGGDVPRLGMGAFVNDKMLPGAAVVKTYEHSFWVRVPGHAEDMYLCAVHLPLYPDHAARKKAFADLAAGYALLQSMAELFLAATSTRGVA